MQQVQLHPRSNHASRDILTLPLFLCLLLPSLPLAGPLGRWTDEEHAQFLDGLRQHGHDWKLLAKNFVQTRTAIQVRSHAQKYFQQNLKKAEAEGHRSLPPYHYGDSGTAGGLGSPEPSASGSAATPGTADGSGKKSSASSAAAAAAAVSSLAGLDAATLAASGMDANQLAQIAAMAALGPEGLFGNFSLSGIPPQVAAMLSGVHDFGANPAVTAPAPGSAVKATPAEDEGSGGSAAASADHGHAHGHGSEGHAGHKRSAASAGLDHHGHDDHAAKRGRGGE